MSVYTDFDRLLLRGILSEVRLYVPEAKPREAWVYKVGRDHWEFHYQKFFWHGKASGAYEARYNGWAALLGSLGIGGWER